MSDREFLDDLYRAARQRPLRGVIAVALIATAGLALRCTERLLGVRTGTVLAAARAACTPDATPH